MRDARILLVLGTRPEAIKLAPVIARLSRVDGLTPIIVNTGQHRDLAGEALAAFGLAAHHRLDVMTHDQSLGALTGRLHLALDGVLEAERPDIVIVQGDTTSAMVGALAAFYRRIAIAHVEAGLRTFHRDAPFPEEVNRSIIGQLADLHFAPTMAARDNLLAAGVAAQAIEVTGNTAVDAVRQMAARIAGGEQPPSLSPEILARLEGKRVILLTLHRRESFGAPLLRMLEAVRALAARGDVAILFPVHPNPALAGPVRATLGETDGVCLVAPLDYPAFVAALQRADFVMTDSGGVQEEAPSLGKPVIVLRRRTERPEAIEAGAAILGGDDGEAILAAATRLLDDPALHAQMARAGNPFGDGCAGERIALSLTRWTTHARHAAP